ncbi:MAG: protein-tyrosine phosphatase [Bacteriovoracaceae bacterium]|jgi:protein-tyrosine phosphatase
MKILFVCLGNICRSPTAEGVLKSFCAEAQLKWEIDSAGTSGHHIGERADERMRSHALERGYSLESRSRKFDPHKDFEAFDKIIVMDEHNQRDIKNLDLNKKYSSKIELMTNYCSKFEASKVPDPYYGGAEGFEVVLDIVEDACRGIIKAHT